MKLLQITLLLLIAPELHAADITADSQNHAKHKKSSHKGKHHHKKDLDAKNEAEPNTDHDPLSDFIINASPEDFEKLLADN